MSVVCHERVIRPNAYMLIHQMSSGFWGKMEEIKDEFIDEYTSKLLNIYPYIYRIYRNKITGSILFKSINDKNSTPENFTNRPPNYLCSLTEI